MNKKILGLALACSLLGACSEPCSEEVLKEKMEEITVKMQELAASGDMGKLMEFTQKAQRIGQSMQGNGDHMEAACEAADAILDEL